ncbi:Cuticle protein 16.8 [Nymphon striatum]|nr:Cuticle protein 16.8 [Nymphon striatum]
MYLVKRQGPKTARFRLEGLSKVCGISALISADCNGMAYWFRVELSGEIAGSHPGSGSFFIFIPEEAGIIERTSSCRIKKYKVKPSRRPLTYLAAIKKKACSVWMEWGEFISIYKGLAKGWPTGRDPRLCLRDLDNFMVKTPNLAKIKIIKHDQDLCSPVLIPLQTLILKPCNFQKSMIDGFLKDGRSNVKRKQDLGSIFDVGKSTSLYVEYALRLCKLNLPANLPILLKLPLLFLFVSETIVENQYSPDLGRCCSPPHFLVDNKGICAYDLSSRALYTKPITIDPIDWKGSALKRKGSAYEKDSSQKDFKATPDYKQGNYNKKFGVTETNQVNYEYPTVLCSYGPCHSPCGVSTKNSCQLSWSTCFENESTRLLNKLISTYISLTRFQNMYSSSAGSCSLLILHMDYDMDRKSKGLMRSRRRSKTVLYYTLPVLDKTLISEKNTKELNVALFIAFAVIGDAFGQGLRYGRNQGKYVNQGNTFTQGNAYKQKATGYRQAAPLRTNTYQQATPLISNNYNQEATGYRQAAPLRTNTYQQATPFVSNNFRQPAPVVNNYRQETPFLSNFRQPVGQQLVQAVAPRVQQVQVTRPVEQYNESPEPFQYSYNFEDEYGNQQYKEETSDESGNVVGRYGYTDTNGIYRQVEYTAGAYGAQFQIQTNEPGTKTSQPADVVINSDAVEVAYQQPIQREVYQAPVRQVLQAPVRQTYQAPVRQTYQAPVRQTYQAPVRQTFQAPQQLSYIAPAHQQQVYTNQVRPEYVQPVQNTYTTGQQYTTGGLGFTGGQQEVDFREKTNDLIAGSHRWLVFDSSSTELHVNRSRDGPEISKNQLTT